MNTLKQNARERAGLPELLCPVGSFDVLKSAVTAGADAVYLGASSFNARINAQNFDSDTLKEAVNLAHDGGVRVYLTLNTAIFDREMSALLRTAESAATAGVDAFIVADIGAAAEIHRRLPNMPLHASTQMSGHSADMGIMLRSMGFTRFVIAREATLFDLMSAVNHSGLEVEAFIHGALCVSHSGQCLFSSIVGGRSGNRGECAQPCRLPYSGRNAYPLSLKDLSLACHVPQLIDSGVASLKIEGRMKGEDYVRTVTSIWRTLLDERRGAAPEEINELAAAFSRGGFTDGYFTGKINSSMMGIRSDADKQKSAALISRPLPKQGFLPADMKINIKADSPVTLTASAPVYRADSNSVGVTVECPAPDIAENRPVTEADVLKNLSKTGGTAYYPNDIDVSVGDGLIIPLSRINSLRRDAIAELDSARRERIAEDVRLRAFKNEDLAIKKRPESTRENSVTARFPSISDVTPSAWEYFSEIYVPLTAWCEQSCSEHSDKIGVILPPVIFDRDREEVLDMLVGTLKSGINKVMIGNIGHIPLVREAASKANVQMPRILGDYRLNVTSRYTALSLEELGFDGFILSPELSLPQMRDIEGRASSIVYGRITLMTLEKCAIRELYGRDACTVCGQNGATMRDRKGISFPILREWKHRNIILNSLPLSMTDKDEDLRRANVTSRHFIFTLEDANTVDRVIVAAKTCMAIKGEVRRISK